MTPDSGLEFLRRLGSVPVSALVRNVQGTFLVLPLDGESYPVLVPSCDADQSNISSFHTHYLKYPVWEWRRKVQPGLKRRVGLAGFRGLNLLLPRAGLDRVVYCDNWLLATNPLREWSPALLRRMTARLVSDYPDRAVVVRSVGEVSPEMMECFHSVGYRLIRSRRVYLFDPLQPRIQHNHDLRQDLRLVRETAPFRDSGPFSESDYQVMERLYSVLYREHFPVYNPAYTAEFFRVACESGGIRIEAYRASPGGRLRAFVGYWSGSQGIIGLMMGMEMDAPDRFDLYRACMGLLFEHAFQSGKLLNLSAGSPEFKMNRRAVPKIEFDAVFDRHLSSSGRSRWFLLESVFNTAAVLGLDNVEASRHLLSPTGGTETKNAADPGAGRRRKARRKAGESGVDPLRVIFLGTDTNPSSQAVFEALSRIRGCDLSAGIFSPFRQPALRVMRRCYKREGLAGLFRLGGQAVLLPLRNTLARLGYKPGNARSMREFARNRGIDFFWGNEINSPETIRRIEQARPDLIVVSGFRKLLGKRVIRSARLGAINAHLSLLPLYRGPDPVYWVLRNREAGTGVTIHFIDEGIDSGDIVTQQRLSITPDDTEATLRGRLARMAAGLVKSVVERLVDGETLNRRPQDHSRATYFGLPAQEP